MSVGKRLTPFTTVSLAICVILSPWSVPNNAYPLSFRPHYAQYVDPVTGTTSKIIVVQCSVVVCRAEDLWLSLYVCCVGRGFLVRSRCACCVWVEQVPAAMGMSWQDGYE